MLFKGPRTAEKRVLNVSEQVLDTHLFRLESAHGGTHMQEGPLEDLVARLDLQPTDMSLDLY